MKIVVNGEPREIASPMTITGLIQALDIKQPLMVTVEHNDEILERDTFETTRIAEGDRIEFLYFMGGGA